MANTDDINNDITTMCQKLIGPLCHMTLTCHINFSCHQCHVAPTCTLHQKKKNQVAQWYLWVCIVFVSVYQQKGHKFKSHMWVPHGNHQLIADVTNVSATWHWWHGMLMWHVGATCHVSFFNKKLIEGPNYKCFVFAGVFLKLFFFRN